MTTIVVAGLGRCGSSLVMQMLAAAGCQMTGEYPAYEDLQVEFDGDRFDAFLWSGHAVKLLDPHRKRLDLTGAKIIWLDRDPEQQARSISKFGHLLAGLPEYDMAQLDLLEMTLKRDRKVSIGKIQSTGCPLLTLSFEGLLTIPGAVDSVIATFIGQGDPKAMEAVVRKRDPRCYPGLFETELLAPA